MSCYRPITINNPKLVKNNVYDRAQIEVPCGSCHACKETKRLGWFVRLFYEWQFCVDNHGFALYETLTYNNEHLPYLFVPFENKVPCFSTRHVQLYLKRIRKKLSSLYPDVKGGFFKYFLSMEYGAKRHRPHYHVIFFVSNSKIDRFTFKKVVEDLWHENGFTKAGYDFGFINGQGGLSYCSKYVCKDLFDDSYFRKIGLKFQMYGLSKSDIKEFFPHNMQSINLGIYALECDKINDLTNFFDGNIYIPDKEKGVRQYHLPLYYERKLFYTVKYRYFDENSQSYYAADDISSVPVGCDYSPIYELNDLGLEMKSIRLKNTIDAVKNVYRVIQSIPNFNDTLLFKLNEKFKTSYENIKAFQNRVKQSFSEEVFVAYSLVYRGCSLSFVPSPVNFPSVDIYRDSMLIHTMSRGIRPLSLDYNNFCNNIDLFNSIPDIEDLYQQIRFLYYLIHLELEDFFNKREIDYCNQKSVYLAQTEIV